MSHKQAGSCKRFEQAQSARLSLAYRFSMRVTPASPRCHPADSPSRKKNLRQNLVGPPDKVLTGLRAPSCSRTALVTWT